MSLIGPVAAGTSLVVAVFLLARLPISPTSDLFLGTRFDHGRYRYARATQQSEGALC